MLGSLLALLLFRFFIAASTDLILPYLRALALWVNSALSGARGAAPNARKSCFYFVLGGVTGLPRSISCWRVEASARAASRFRSA